MKRIKHNESNEVLIMKRKLCIQLFAFLLAGFSFGTAISSVIIRDFNETFMDTRTPNLILFKHLLFKYS